jgi:dTDP-4-amino-4,6-dideoxygalactose transaminase
MHGFNSRLDAIQAAILRVKLKHLDDWSKLRRDRVLLYNQQLRQIDGIGLPYVAHSNSISANYYTIRLLNQRIKRDELRSFLASNGIETAVYYPLSLHLQEVYKTLGYKYGDFPESERAQEEVLSLPMFPEITQEQVEEVVNRIHKFFNR